MDTLNQNCSNHDIKTNNTQTKIMNLGIKHNKLNVNGTTINQMQEQDGRLETECKR
uniref:Uncharacterized protein n=1 Tax=Arion vulgaris TaxID=1028688 RepID=A0A0B7BID0_9EUPU